MRLLILAAALVATQVLAANLNMRPGLWDLNVSVTTDGKTTNLADQISAAMAKMPLEQKKKAQEMLGGSSMMKGTPACISKEMLDPETFAKKQSSEKCPATFKTRTATEIKASFKCADGAKGEMHWKIPNPETINGQVEMESAKGKKTKIESQGKWLSADCGKVRPFGGQ